MQLRHKGLLYEFEYDYVPNDGTDANVCTVIPDGRQIDGQIRVTEVRIDGWPGPVSDVAMNLMWRAAATDYLDLQAEALRQRLQRQ